MKPGQDEYTDMNTEPFARLQEAETQVKQKGNILRKKSLLFFVSSMVLVTILIMAGIAWYTRVANTYAVSFDVAEYDLAVNENVDKEYLLDIFEYSNVTNEKMAPGTVGCIPLKLSAYRSDVDVTYSVSIQSFIPHTDEMNIQQHMRFYYLKEGNSIHYGDAVLPKRNGNNIVYFKEGNTTYTKEYLDNINKDNNNATLSEIKDTIKKGDNSKTLCIYWEWYWDADAAKEDRAPKMPETLTDQFRESWDDLDTDIGRYPDKYKDSFTIYLYTSGVQAIPNLTQKPGTGGTNP